MPKSPERCQEIRKEMHDKILDNAILYFAKNGFSGTKISDLAKHIGIGQGTLYLYFKSKEDLFHEIFAVINNSKDVHELKGLLPIPIAAKHKIHLLSKSIIEKMQQHECYAAKIALNTQMMLEQSGFSSDDTTYQSDLYNYTAKIIEQGQKEGSVVKGSPMKLADYYWALCISMH